MASFSLGLRHRVLDAALTPDSPIEHAGAVRFGVSRGFVQKLKRRWRSHGTAEPVGHRCGAQPKLSDDDRAPLAAGVEVEPDAAGARRGVGVHVAHRATSVRLRIGRLREDAEAEEEPDAVADAADAGVSTARTATGRA